MFEINEKRIRIYANDNTYSRGLIYYLQKKVNSINVDNFYDKSMKDDVTSICARVQSSGNWEYESNIDFCQKNGFIHFDCECEAFKAKQNGSKICKHIVAVLIKYYKESGISKNPNKLNKIDRLIEQIKHSALEPSYEKKKVNLEVKYEHEINTDRCSSIELKVGESKNYVVKNMRDFLTSIKTKKSIIEFGKSFTYDPKVYDFKEEDVELINLLLEIHEMDIKFASISNSYNRYSGAQIKLISGKKAYLTELQLKRFFNIMSNRKMDAVIRGKAYSDVRILTEELPLGFNLKTESDRVILKSIEELPVPLINGGDYFFMKSNIYKPSKEQARIFSHFYNLLINDRNREAVIKKEDCEKIASYIIPNLKRISDVVEIDEELENSFYEEPLKATVYLDKEGENATADVIYKYGTLELSPFGGNTKREDGKILVRDIEEELNIVGILQNFGFVKEKHRFTLKDEEKLINFLTGGLNALQDRVEIYYSESFKSIKVYNTSNMKSSVKLTDNDLLEFSFNIEGVDKEEIKSIFKALKEKKKYYRLKKGGFVSLESKELNDLGNMIEYLNIKDSDLIKDKIILSKYNALYIDQNLKENSMTFIERNNKFRELVNNIRDIQDMDYAIPNTLDKVMRNYQKFGYKWFKTLSSCGFGGILADEMGLGKTLQAISFITSERGESKNPALVIAPTSLVYNWKSEIEKFAPELKTLVISGNKIEREELRREMAEHDVVITSYPLIRRDIEEYKNIEFNHCFLDEAQQIKNPTSINAQSVKEIKANGYFALTGTPIENSLTELWSIFDFIMPGYLLSQGKFSKKYEVPIMKDKDKKALEELNKHIKPFILRRLKKDVAKELPPKIEHKIVIEMTEEQKKLYMVYLASVKGEIDEEIKEKGFNKSKIKILVALTRLRQICCEPAVFMENFKGESGKMLALDDLLEESISEGHRILLFSQFTSVLKNIIPRLEKNNIEYMYLDGSTKSELRGPMVKEFNEGKGSVFLISLKAGGTGLNLTGADVVIHFDPWWNPAVEDQASDRAHRIGQKKTVEVIKLIARGTIEEKIFELQEKKKQIIKSVLDENTEESLITKLSEEELKELFEA